MNDQTTAPQPTGQPMRFVAFSRIGDDLYRLVVDDVSIEMDGFAANRLRLYVESIIGSGFARTFQPRGKSS